MKWMFAGTMLILLAACGVDGKPIRPSASTTVGVGTSGVSAGANVGIRRGIFRVGAGLGL